MKTYLVTGAAGFIGSRVAERLLKEGNTIITIDNLSTGNIDAIPKGVTFILGNCQDRAVIKKLQPYKFDAIIHIAGQSSGEISFDDPVYDLQTNTESTLLLLNLAKEMQCKKFIYASTMSVYGQQPGSPVAEDALLKPRSFYAVGKIASESYMNIFSELGITATSLRLFNAYGPGQNMENLRQGMVSIYLAQAISGKHIHVKGSKDRYRDFVYIEDIVDAFILSLKREGGYDCFNIATGVKTTVEDLICIISKLLPFKVSVEYSGSTPGDQFGIYGDFSKASRILGWKPKVKLEEGLRIMAEWAIGGKNE